MIPLTLARIAELTGGRVHGPADLVVDGPVVTDSREAGAGSLYVARVGEHADGHDFVGGAVGRGAVAVLGTRVVDDTPTVLVDDVQEAFAALASGVIAASPDLVVIGLTGSSGKTTTKDLLAAVLARHGETVATIGSLNSEVGVPLTVCRITPTTRYLVLEMGARGIGHIAYLTDMTHPSIGAVLNVGSAHVGEFGSREAIATAKGELVAALPPGGLAVLNGDDPLVAAMRVPGGVRVALTGRDDRTPAPVEPPAGVTRVRAADVRLDPSGCAAFTLVTAAGEAEVRLRLLGDHQVDNALAVAAIALDLDMSLRDVAAALSASGPGSRWRMERHERPDGVLVVNDAYNANPESMDAALRTLARMIGPAGPSGPSGATGTADRANGGAERPRRWAVLGEMLELGPSGPQLHRAVGSLARELEIDEVLAVGPGAGPVADGAGAPAGSGDEDRPTTRARRVRDTEEAYEVLESELRSGDVVLLKSSRDSGLRLLGDRLVQSSGAPAASSGGGAS